MSSRSDCSPSQAAGLEKAIAECLGFPIQVISAYRENGKLNVHIRYEPSGSKPTPGSS